MTSNLSGVTSDPSQKSPKETEELRRLKQARERVLARLWKIADLDPEMTRNSMSAQIKAISMIVAIEGLIPHRNDDRRAASAQNKSSSPTVHPQTDAWFREQQEKTTGPQFNPDAVRDEDGPGVPAETTPSVPPAPLSASAPGNRLPVYVEKKPDTWRLRL
jgi:hypothetical protein